MPGVRDDVAVVGQRLLLHHPREDRPLQATLGHEGEIEGDAPRRERIEEDLDVGLVRLEAEVAAGDGPEGRGGETDARRGRAEGYVAFKIKVGVADPRADAERTRSICEALDGGGGLLVCADANQGWTPEDAITYARAVADTSLAFFEQPVPAHDVEGMARVARASRVPVGCDEGLHSIEDLRRHHEARAAGGFSLKTIKLGGMKPVVEAALLCDELGLKVNLASKMAETGVSTAALLQLAAAIPAVDWGVGLSSHYLTDDILREPLAIRGGGHNIAGFGTCDDGVVLDLSPMKSIRVDPEARLARVESGLLWSEIDQETQAFGLAVTGGVMSSTGVGGFTLGGGIGWLQRKLGLACDNLRTADLVTADGELVQASERQNPELLWGLRGGGGNFGIVTAFQFDLHPVGPLVYSGLVAWPAQQARDVLGFFREFTADTPEELTLIAICRTAPPAPFLPAEVHGMPIVAIAACYAGSVEDGERALAPLRAFGSPVGDAFGPRPYPSFNAMFDASWAPGFENYWKAEFLTGLPDDCIEVLADFAVRHTSPLSDFKIARLGGAIARVGEDDTAYGHRSAPFILNVNTRWTERAETDLHVTHTRDLWEATLPFTAGGAYVNFLGDEGADRVRAAYGRAKFQRLQALKRKFDPDNVFRLNHNIPPSRGAAPEPGGRVPA